MKTIFLKLLTLSSLIFSLLFAATSGGEESLQDYILHHIQDSSHWIPIPGNFLVFDLNSVNNLNIAGVQFANGLHGLMLIFASLFLFLFFVIFYKKNDQKAPRGLTNALETVVLFVRNDICINYLGDKDGRKFAPVFLNFFFMILILNLMGLIPLFATATANVNVTAGFALITLSMMLFFGVARNGIFGFFKLFIPSGVPIPVLIILFPIELIGFFVKPFALTIRLFANMLAGHLVIFSVIGLVVTFGMFGFPALFLALFIYVLEILVAFLQAFIFTMLSAMFVGEVLNPHH